MNEHTHAIIIIKNDKGEYLQYFDNRWNSFLFPNCKLIDENHSDIILNCIKQKFCLPFKNVSINYVMDKVHEKFSESAQKIKKYHHYFYVVNYDKNPNISESDNFTINDINYAWYSLNQLENDKRIQEVNSDIVDMIKEKGL